MAKYWIAVACRDHVQGAIDGSFMQLCHGKQNPLKRLKEGDWILYYSPSIHFKEKKPYRHFTALGKVSGHEPYLLDSNSEFKPWRKDVTYYPFSDLSIEPLLSSLSFTKERKYWGLPFRSGFFEISREDFECITKHISTDSEKELA